MQASKSHEQIFGKSPKAFNPVNMGTLCEFVIAVPNTKMLLIATAYKAIIATTAVRVNNVLELNAASDDG